MTAGRRLASCLALALVLASDRALAQAAGPGEPTERRLTLRFDRIDLVTALARLRSIYGVPLAYSPDAVPAGRVVTLAAEDQSVGRILEQLLAGTGLRLIPLAGGTLVVAPGLTDALSQGRSPVPNIATGIRQLDQIVVMGTPVAGGPERDNPTAVSVIRASDLRNYHFSRTADLFRAALPGLVLWDQGPSGPPAEIAAVRGASSFSARGLKTYLDGVEVASPEVVTLIDPRSIERIEVIRGPQGAALYGSDAINGVIQIVTKKGSFGETEKLQASANAAAGPFDRQALDNPMLRQDYAGGLTWGGSRASLAATGTLGRVGTATSAPFTKNWNLHAGGQAAFGTLLISGFARAGQMSFAADPLLAAPWGSATTPVGAAEVEVGTLGLTAVHQVSNRLVQTLVTGYDRAAGALGAHRATLSTYRLPLDPNHQSADRASIRYSMTHSAEFGAVASLSTTGGLEHAQLSYARGSWDDRVSSAYYALYRDRVNNSGAFLQTKLRAGALLLNAGARAEWSSSVGTQVGTAWAPSIGVSWTQPLGPVALRIRGGWGKGIRPPEPGMSRSMATPRVEQQANPNLAPESQSGYELGADLYAGTSGYARLTYFDQSARDLIQGVIFPTIPGTKPRYQFQNVGGIHNRGLELEGGFRLGRVGLDAAYYATSSVVDRIAPTYSGPLRLGDQLPEIPRGSGSLRVSYLGRKVHVGVGGNYLGAWTGQDWAAIARAVSTQSASRLSARDYLIRYPGLFKPYLNLSFDVAREFTAYLNIDNFTRSSALERNNLSQPAGRSVLFGLEIRP